MAHSNAVAEGRGFGGDLEVGWMPAVASGTPLEAIPWAIDLPMIVETSEFSTAREFSSSFNNSTEFVGGKFDAALATSSWACLQ